MKKKILVFSSTTIFSLTALAQIGVNTSTPQATLDIVGKPTNPAIADGVICPRITGVQLKGKDNAYTALQDGMIVYVTSPLTVTQTTSRTVNVLEKGYYYFDASKGTVGQWVKMYHDYSAVLAGVDGADAYTGSPVTISAANNNTVTQLVTSKTFTITQKSMVTFTYTLSVNDLLTASGAFLSDGRAKLYGANLYWIDGGGIFPNGSLIATQSASFSTTANYAAGFYYPNNTRSIVLPAGTYNVGLQAVVYANDTTGVRATFGSGIRDIFDIIAVPMPY